MTEIIIDGVDVSGCEKYPLSNKWHGSIIFCNGGCNAYPNCEYKQLQRKTQECKYLEEEKADKINLLAQIIEILYPNADDAEKYSIAFNCEFIDKAKQIMQALDEIEEYTIKNFCQNCEADDYPASCPTCEYQEYFDIISKAKGEEE